MHSSCTAYAQPRPVQPPPPKPGVCGACGGKRQAWSLLSCRHGEPAMPRDTDAHPPAGQLYPPRRDCATAGVDVRMSALGSGHDFVRSFARTADIGSVFIFTRVGDPWLHADVLAGTDRRRWPLPGVVKLATLSANTPQGSEFHERTQNRKTYLF